MAGQTAVIMQGQGNVTVRTFDGLPAASAGHKAGISAPVDEQHDLLLLLQTVLYQLLQPPAEDGFISLSQLPAHIHNLG